ncbi:pantothenate kinase [Almyronema epifaneia]|uniref:Type III pantothenate kinase n=1 Tax=Almyronema epifaneia S1 TaxID=2991925 RepID=A0ABW6IBA3_9CYAN
MADSSAWLALIIGNTRLHWGVFAQESLQATWHTRYLNAHDVATLIHHRFDSAAWRQITFAPVPDLERSASQPIKLWLASVVPAQLQLWQAYRGLQLVERDRLWIKNLYATLGIDRILALVGAGEQYGWPALVIDAGTALTFTAGNQHQFLGGAILPGLKLQMQALATGTAALPNIDRWEVIPPQRWAFDTAEAMRSGVFYTQMAGVQDYLTDWWRRYPQGQALLTGGDSPILSLYLKKIRPDLSERLSVNEDLAFWGIQAYRRHILG